MPVVHLDAELSVDQLVNAVTQLPQPEYEEFLNTINRIHPLHEKHHLSARESELLLKINQGIPSDIQRRYDEQAQLKMAHRTDEPSDAELENAERFRRMIQGGPEVDLG